MQTLTKLNIIALDKPKEYELLEQFRVDLFNTFDLKLLIAKRKLLKKAIKTLFTKEEQIELNKHF